MATGDPEKDGWERADFPIICETCLGDNPYLRMTKAQYDRECKVCARPFTVFRWRAGTGGRYKKTEICQICAKSKNICQTCLLDLEFGLPVQVRDAALPRGSLDTLPVSDVNREWFSRQAEAALSVGGYLPYDRVNYNPLITRMARTTPYYKRNLPHVCSFFVKGSCARGDECPYRHEMPTEGELANQNIKDRYYGRNDPVAKKLLRRHDDFTSKIAPPSDKDVKTLYVGNVDSRITEQNLRDHFYHFGEILSIKMVPSANCAFVTFLMREAAEQAAQKLYNNLIINGVFLKIQWGKPQQKDPEKIPARPEIAPPGFYRAPSSVPYYPSMNPQRMGSTPEPSGYNLHYHQPPSPPGRLSPGNVELASEPSSTLNDPEPGDTLNRKNKVPPTEETEQPNKKRPKVSEEEESK
eukprot:TRINITY_DN6231_c0_g1_i1.p1 TRINITY_DN6231_c0_g1~~TRINITY_DN6231_c0_g1_i1.p1  ORF type:complete len:411 (-),score=72.13 TRINITY_DN6231_c0_g1_i1:111-1343(-)